MAHKPITIDEVYFEEHREEVLALIARLFPRAEPVAAPGWRSRIRVAPWRAENPELAAAKDAAKSSDQAAKRRGAPRCDHLSCLAVGPSALSWQTNEHVCYICGTTVWLGVNLHMDHVVPISRGGVHCADNLRPACRFCNLSKGDIVSA